MRFHSKSPYFKPTRPDELEQAEGAFEEDETTIAPPLRKRLTQILMVALVLTTLVSLAIAKSVSDHSEQVISTANEAIHARETAEARITTLANEINATTPITQTWLTHSREWAYAALTQLDADPERATLIALEAMQAAHTPEAEDALRRALTAWHLRLELRQPGAKIQTVEFAPDGELIVTTNSVGEARVWQLSGNLGPLLHAQSHIRSAQFSPDARFILTLTSNQLALLWNAQTGANVAALSGHGVDFTTAQFGSTSDSVVLGDDNGNVHSWYWYKGRLTDQVISDTMVYTSAVGPIGHLELTPDLILARGKQGVVVWDRWSGRQLYTVTYAPTQQAIWAAHLASGNRLILVGAVDTRIIDVSTGQVLRTLPGVTDGLVRFSPDDGFMYADGILRELETGKVVAYFPREQSTIAQFSPNSNTLLTYSTPRTMSVWNLRSGAWPPALVTTIKTSDDPYIAHFSPDSQAILTVEMNGTAHLWALQPDTDLISNSDLQMIALWRVTHSLTCEERHTYLHDAKACSTTTP